jgi:putative hemolysin
MEPPSEPTDTEIPQQLFNQIYFLDVIASQGISSWLFIGLVIMFILLFFSAFFSAAENAFFSISNKDLSEINEKNLPGTDKISQLLSKPRILLAGILIGNNFINICFVVFTSLYIDEVFHFNFLPWVEFVVKVILVTFILLIFGEVIPKTYATKFNQQVAVIIAVPMFRYLKIFGFLIYPLANSVAYFDRKFSREEKSLSAEELTHAIDITTSDESEEEEKTILKKLVHFGNTDVKQIMKPRLDVVAIELNAPFSDLLNIVKEHGYSRVPVYYETFDQTEGLIYIKDILPYLNESPKFNWKKLIKPAFFVPESKKIDSLLKEFQEKRIHMAIVVDEYGGKSGIVTMEDVLEEIFGEINDEYDDEANLISKIDKNTYVADAKISIIDLCQFLELPNDAFEEVRGENETLGGLILEINGKIPEKSNKISFGNIDFIIESVDKRRIKKVSILIHE